MKRGMGWSPQHSKQTNHDGNTAYKQGCTSRGTVKVLVFASLQEHHGCKLACNIRILFHAMNKASLKWNKWSHTKGKNRLLLSDLSANPRINFSIILAKCRVSITRTQLFRSNACKGCPFADNDTINHPLPVHQSTTQALSKPQQRNLGNT